MQKRMIVSLMGAIALVFLVSSLVYSQVNAQNDEQLTQADFINILIRILGLEDQLPTAATLSDRIELLGELGYAPVGGWQPEDTLTKGDVAAALARILRVDVPVAATPKEYIQTLTDRGIMVAGSPERPFSLPDLTTAINMAAAMPNTLTVERGNAMLAPSQSTSSSWPWWWWWWWIWWWENLSPKK